MSTLEEEIVRPLKEQLALRTSNGHHPTFTTSKNLTLRWWHHLFIGIVIMGLSIGTCGLFQLKSNWGSVWRTSLHQFQWLVFVKGDSLAVDEVGRFLKQLDGSREVIYLSPEDAVQRFRAEKLSEPLDLLGSNPFPPCWIVTWKENFIGSARMQEAFQDTTALPGVVDVAYDTNLIEKLRTYRLQWLQVKWILTALTLLAVTAGAIVFGFILSRIPFELERRRTLIGSFVSDVAFWSLGFVIVFFSLGHLPWLLLGGGVFVAALRWMTVTALRLS